MVIDKRKKYYIVLDTETCGTLSAPLVYDCGWVVIDKKGTVYRERNFVNRDIFYYSGLMNSCFYHDKLPQYHTEIACGLRKVVNLNYILKVLISDMEDFNTNIVCAHNAMFDFKALNNTKQNFTHGAEDSFFPEGTEIWDTLQMAKDVVVPKPTYQKFCEDNMLMRKDGLPRATAEALFAYLTNNPNYEEEHTGLEDAKIESQILVHCLKQHKPMKKVYVVVGAED